MTIRIGTYAGFRAKSGGTRASQITFRAEAQASVIIERVGTDNRKGSIIEIEEYDRWILDYSPSGWRSFSIPGGWQEGIHVFFQYELFGLPTAVAVPGRALEAGRHFFIFAVDTAMNRKPDLSLYYDFVEVEVSPAE